MADAAHAEEMKEHVRTYIVIFVALMALTVVTVGVSYLPFSQPVGIAVGLLIAAFKASLVAGYFMHLLDERAIIYWVLGFTVLFFGVLLFLPTVT